MSQTDWAKTYAAMDERINLKYERLPKGEQIGKPPQAGSQDEKNPDGWVRGFANSNVRWPSESKLRIWSKFFSVD